MLSLSLSLIPCVVYPECFLYTSSYLYGEDSDIRKALNSPNVDICLDLQKPDHKKFLADISFQITNAPRLREALGLRDYQLQSIESDNARVGNTNIVTYRLLATWVCREGQDARLSALKNSFSEIEFKDILLRDTTATKGGGADLLVSPLFDSIPLTDFSPSLSSTTSTEFEWIFLCSLLKMLRCCWRSVGHLMGIPDQDLEMVAMEYHSLYEQSYHMIYNWQKNGSDVTYGTLFKAITCLFDHCPDRINAAHCYVVERIEQLLSVRCQ